LFPGAVLDEAWAARCSELSRAVERLKCLGSQDALILLRSSFSAPQVQHLIFNYVLSDDQWLQASLPIKDGGLGIRRVPSLATSAILAAAASTLSSSIQNLGFLL